jgi:hypothetical protein
MNTFATIGILFLAALLEAGGDDLVRKGLQSPALVCIGSCWPEQLRCLSMDAL